MKIIVDADACPVRSIVENIAKEKRIPCVFVCDFNHILKSDYAKIVTVDNGKDSADLKILALLESGDLVVTQDYGLAALVLSKNAYAMHQSGMIFNGNNINKLLFERFLAAKVRRSGQKTKNNKKRSETENICFSESLQKWIEENCT